MNIFINIRDGWINDTSYRPADCQATTLDDLMTQALAGSDDYLTASFDAGELCKHPKAYDFLNTYGDKYGSRYEGTEMLYEFAGAKFTVLVDNTVVIGWEE